MAQNLDAIVPRILAQGLVALRENAVMASLVLRNFGEDARNRGSSVDVPVPSPMGQADDVTPSSTPQDGYDLNPSYVPITLDKWKKIGFTLDDSEMSRIVSGYESFQVTEAARTLANAVDRDILNLYKQVWGYAGTPGQHPFQRVPQDPSLIQNYQGLNAASDARKVLNKQLASPQNRLMVLGVEAEANATALPELQNANAAGTDSIIKDANIGTKMGFDWYMNQNILQHTPTLEGTITVTAAVDAGLNTVTISGATTPPTPGDIIRFASDPNPYTILTGSTSTSLLIAPKTRVPLLAGEAITVVGTPDVPHEVNIAFHRDAFALAVRPLLDVDPIGNTIETFTDSVSGLTLRLEISRQNKRTLFEFDILYGVACIRPECACRVLGG